MPNKKLTNALRVRRLRLDLGRIVDTAAPMMVGDDFTELGEGNQFLYVNARTLNAVYTRADGTTYQISVTEIGCIK